jgi:hypothetical protein
MAEMTDARREQLDSIVEEFLHNSRAGRRLVAVDGSDPALAARFADDIAARLTGHDQVAARVSVGAADETTLRSGTIEPFRAGTLPAAESPDTVLVVDGQGVFDQPIHGFWHFRIWVLTGQELPHAGADVIVDATDADAPTRFFYDYCRIPPSAGDGGRR